MFVELVYDKRNFDGLPGAKDIILGELTKRVHRIFPDADVRVKPMMTLPAINTDASKHEKERISAVVQEMFEEADMWLVSEFPTVRQVGL
ncbi:DinI family protein [Escherichia coli]|nr:DinI family protein [Escherichia coli]